MKDANFELAKSHFLKGLDFFHRKMLIEAENAFRHSLSIISDNESALTNLAATLFELKNYSEAEEISKQLLSINNSNHVAWSNRGLVLKELKQYDQALACHDKAISLKPDYAEAWSNRGLVLHARKQYDQALACYDKAIGLKPDFAEAWSNRGVVLKELQLNDQALASYNTAISLEPGYALAYYNRGLALQELKRYDQALASYDSAMRLKPDYVEAWSNRGVALQELMQYDQALASFDKAIRLKPDFAKAWSNRGNALKDMGRFSLAQASYREAIRLDPEFLEARSNLLFSLNYLETISPQEVLAEAKEFGLKVSERAQPKFTAWEVPADAKKLRIGFVSGDLCNHPVGYFIEGLLEQLDQSQFEIFAFPTSVACDDLTQRIKVFFTEWSPIDGMSDQAASTFIHQKGIHVLIDLSGHTAHNRLAVFSFKPAPVQVSWLGYFATTGLPEMDYFLGAPPMSSANEADHFTETLWNLAETWFCLKPPAERVTVATLPALRNGFFTFGSFGNLSKMNDQVVETWSSVLHRVSSSKLLLKSKQLGDLSLAEEVRSRFQKFDIPVERLILEGPASRKDYFAAYQRVDMVLDTFPYPGGTTSLDSLWMGVPVLTLMGDRFLSHLGESIALNAGNSDWIGSDVNDYINKAVQFASDLDRLAQRRSTLRECVSRSPLFDTSRFARNFEKALREMWHQSSQPKAGVINGSRTATPRR